MPLLFVQNTKNVGSMARYQNEDDDYMGRGGRKKPIDSAPNYTIANNKMN